MTKLTNTVIYFVHLGDVEYFNGGKRLAPAMPCGSPDANGILNIFAFTKEGSGVLPSIQHATSLADALNGFKWATIEEAESWGIDLTNPDQDITLIGQ